MDLTFVVAVRYVKAVGRGLLALPAGAVVNALGATILGAPVGFDLYQRLVFLAHHGMIGTEYLLEQSNFQFLIRGHLIFVFIQCMPHTRSSGQPLLPINPEQQRIGRMEAQHEIERMAAQQEQARLAALAAAQVHQQNIDNPGRATNPDDEDLGDDELLNPRRDAEIATPANRRDRQARFRHECQPVQPAFDDDDDNLDGAGATGAIIPPPLAPGAKFNITRTMIQ
ncbi:hypothetical protein CQW23_28446 [Capsicum baccatum]|uniref:Uncharacterized protein n=1 Tax=Capsicum baccatum TaxID=33114 RepID=A0A2G2VGN7_CAPBA|nr:hypothetical protein CQW23_28446 [Capsicum baccatum]